ADGISSPERKHRADMEYGEDDEPDPVVEEVLEASAQIPNIPVPRSTDGNLWVIRMPNFVKVDSKPFHPDTYIGPEQEDDEPQPDENLREKSMSIKLKVENTVRWRWTKDDNGHDKRQSNSRVIRWSDGSLSLQLGKELFDINQAVDTSGAVPRQAFGGSQPPVSSSQLESQSQSQPSGAKAQGLTYLVAQHKRAEILQCEGVITGTMTLRPTGMQSETHRMLVRAVGQKHSKIARLRIAPDPTTDPEREKMELLKQAAKKPRKTKGDDDGLGSGKRRRTGYTRKRAGDDMWSDDEDEDVGFGGGSEDEFGLSGSADRKGKRQRDEENSKRGPGEYQNDDFLVADSEDEDADFVNSDDGSKKKKGRKRRAEETEEDDLDRLEAKIEAEEKKRRAQEEGGGSSAGADKAADDDAMDVESEEDDEDWGVRRAGTGSRKRRAIEFEDDEEE
ncbi:Leo1-like protein-domain-containing protein, partial [Cytidiella melzeri]